MSLRSFKPRITKERYILDSLVSIFRGGHWVEDKLETVAPEPNPTTPAYITVIGGTKYDQKEIELAVTAHSSPGATVLVGEGRGAEAWVAAHDQTYVIPVNPDFYGKSARKVNVDEVLNYAPDSPLLLVGTGERVKQARSWLKRTGSKREVIEIL